MPSDAVSPEPGIIQPEVRVRQLQEILKTDWGKFQRVNIEALIRMYKNGELGPLKRGNPDIFMVDGERVEMDSAERFNNRTHSMCWAEVFYLIPTLF